MKKKTVRNTGIPEERYKMLYRWKTLYTSIFKVDSTQQVYCKL